MKTYIEIGDFVDSGGPGGGSTVAEWVTEYDQTWADEAAGGTIDLTAEGASWDDQHGVTWTLNSISALDTGEINATDGLFCEDNSFDGTGQMYASIADMVAVGGGPAYDWLRDRIQTILVFDEVVTDGLINTGMTCQIATIVHYVYDNAGGSPIFQVGDNATVVSEARAVDNMLLSVESCGEAVKSYRALASAPIPDTPEDLATPFLAAGEYTVSGISRIAVATPTHWNLALNLRTRASGTVSYKLSRTIIRRLRVP